MCGRRVSMGEEEKERDQHEDRGERINNHNLHAN